MYWFPLPLLWYTIVKLVPQPPEYLRSTVPPVKVVR